MQGARHNTEIGWRLYIELGLRGFVTMLQFEAVLLRGFVFALRLCRTYIFKQLDEERVWPQFQLRHSQKLSVQISSLNRAGRCRHGFLATGHNGRILIDGVDALMDGGDCVRSHRNTLQRFCSTAKSSSSFSNESIDSWRAILRTAPKLLSLGILLSLMKKSWILVYLHPSATDGRNQVD
jgi:hypothetical protein